jgi:tetratricopeptide (TPR) repeat protein
MQRSRPSATDPRPAPPGPSTRISPRARDLFLAASLLCLTLIAYYPALRGALLWDDDAHVTKPELLSLHGLWRIWFDLGATQQYYPLLHTAFWIEHRLWGGAVLGYHLTNVGLHGIAALLVVALARKLGLVTAAWPAGFLFALHPVLVEAVAWISEQKSTLSGVFYLGSALMYLDFDRTRRRSRYVLALVLFVMALLTKSVTATLPAALLLVIWLQRGRLDGKRNAFPLLPWFGMGAAAGLFTAWVERTLIGAQGPDFALTLLDRTLLAGRVVWFYLGKLAFPANLMFFYPRWNIDASQWWQYLFPLALLALIAALTWFTKTRRWPLVALLFFIGTLFPVLGFLNVYPFVYSYVADHFTYLASLGVIIPVAAAAARRPYWNALLVALLAVLTWRQARMYKNVETLYTETLLRNPASWISHNNLGNVFLDKPGRLDEAIGHFQTALRLKPNFPLTLNNLGGALLKIPGRETEALADLQKAVSLEPDFADAHNNLGSAWARLGRLPDAIAEFETALKLKPNFPRTLNNLGSALLKIPGRETEALADLQKAVSLEPDFAEAHTNLGAALSKIPGRMADAVAEYQVALQLDSGSAEAHNNLAVAYSQIPGRTNDVISEYEAALRANPNSAEAHNNLAAALTELGRLPEAVGHLQAALRLNSNSADAHTNLGIVYSKMRGRMPDAIAEYRRALQLNPNQANAHDNLGIALVQAGRTNEAILHFEAAVRSAPNSAEIRMNLGNVLLDIPGRLPEAVAQFTAALQFRPDLFKPHFLLGLASLRVPGRAEEGLSQIEAALKITPDPDAQRIVNRLRRLKH